jgi:hypothetical protein
MNKPHKHTELIKQWADSSSGSTWTRASDSVRSYWKLLKFIEKFETDWQEQDYQLYEIPNGKYVFMCHSKYVSLGALNMSKQCAEKLCDMLNNGEIEL